MFAYVVRRLLISIVVLFFATIFVFLLVASSGNPLALLNANPHIPHSTIVARENLLHLNDPLWQRYWIWFSGAIHGNLGTTINGQDVASQLTSHLFVTLRMVVIATVIAIFVAIFMGVMAAVRQGKVTDHAITVTNFVLLATPIFVLGLALKEFVAIPINQHARDDHLLHRRRAEPDAQRLLLQPTARLRRAHRVAGDHAHAHLLRLVGDLPALVHDRDTRRRPRPPGPGQGPEPAPGPRPPRPAQRARSPSPRSSRSTSPPSSAAPSSPRSSSGGRGSGSGTSPGSPTSTSTSCWPICSSLPPS